jgi:hypothetical protein
MGETIPSGTRGQLESIVEEKKEEEEHQGEAR